MSAFITCRNNFDEIVSIPKEKFVFRPSVLAVIVKDKKVLTVNTTSNNKIWLPGGGVKIGESLNNALKRECFEETGLRLKNIGEMLAFKENFFYFQPTDLAMHILAFIFRCEIEEGAFNPQGIEATEDIANPQWTPIDKIQKEDLNDLKDDIYQILNNLK